MVKRVELAKIAKKLMYLSIFMPILHFIFYILPYPEFINGITNVKDIGASADFLAGTITPILTLAAFLLLLESYNLQKEELAQTREEMKRSAEALEQQRKIMEDEKNLSESQKELETFIKLLERWEPLGNSVKVTVPVFKINASTGNLVYDCKDIEELDLRKFYEMLGDIIVNRRNGVIIWQNLSEIKFQNFYAKDLKALAENVVMARAFNYFAKFYLSLQYIDNMKYEDMKKLALNNLKMSLTAGERYIFSIVVELNMVVLDTEDDDFKRLLNKYSEFFIL